MNKLLTIAALASLSFATDDFQDNNLGFFRDLGKELKKNFAPVAYDDNEFFSLHNLEADFQKAGQFLAQHPELVKQGEQVVGQMIHKYSGHKDLLKQDAKKALEFVAQHPEVIKQAVELIKSFKHKETNAAAFDDEELFSVTEMIKGIKQDIKDNINRAKQGKEIAQHLIKDKLAGGFDDEELFNLGGLINDGINVYKDVKTHNYGGLVSHGIQTVKDIKRHDDAEDNELASVSSIIQKVEQDVIKSVQRVGQGVKVANQMVKDSVGKFKNAVSHDDEELFSVTDIIRDVKDNIHRAKEGVEIAKHLINDQIQKGAHHDDEELFSVSEMIKGVKQGIKDNINRAKQGNEIAQQLIKDKLAGGFDDEELFNLGGLINDGLNIYNDVKTHNYGALVNHGIETVKDVKQATQGKKFLRH